MKQYEKDAIDAGRRYEFHNELYSLDWFCADVFRDYEDEADISGLNYFIEELEKTITNLQYHVTTAKRTIKRIVVQEVFETCTPEGKTEKEAILDATIDAMLDATLDAMKDIPIEDILEQGHKYLNEKFGNDNSTNEDFTS